MNERMEEAEAVYRQIRVPAKIVRYWTDYIIGDNGDDVQLLFCGLEDGRVYQSMRVGEERVWVMHTPAVPDR